MSEGQLTALLFAVFAALLAAGVPVAFALGLAAFAWALAAGVPILVVAQKIASQMGDPTLLAIPFFILAGEIMTAGTMARRLVDLANVTVGFLRGGLAMVNVVASMFFGGISGSSVADTSSIGSILVPMMTSRGYDRGFSVAVTRPRASSCRRPTTRSSTHWPPAARSPSARSSSAGTFPGS